MSPFRKVIISTITVFLSYFVLLSLLILSYFVLGDLGNSLGGAVGGGVLLLLFLPGVFISILIQRLVTGRDRNLQWDETVYLLKTVFITLILVASIYLSSYLNPFNSNWSLVLNLIAALSLWSVFTYFTFGFVNKLLPGKSSFIVVIFHILIACIGIFKLIEGFE